MRCGEARRVLWPEGGPRKLTQDGAAEAHLRGCVACQRFLSDQRQIATQLRELTPARPAPAAVRTAVFEALARERARSASHPGWLVRVAAIALVTGVTGGGIWNLLDQSPDQAWSGRLIELSQDHRRATQEDVILSSDTADVKDWLRRRVSFAVHVPSAPDVVLEGARVCDLSGRRAVVLMYRIDDEVVSFYLTPARPTDPTALEPAQVVRAVDSGFESIAWQGAGLVHALVGGVPAARLREFSKYCLDVPAGWTNR